MTSSWFSLHTHSQFSALDGMSTVESLIERAARFKQPGFALTDHGVLSGTVKGYQAAKKHDIKFFPGSELYIIDPQYDRSTLEDSGSAQRYHLGAVALDLRGYQGLVQLSTLSFERPRFNRFPRLLVDDLVEWGQEFGKHIAITTGCVFGLFEKTLIDSGPDAAEGVLRMLEQVTPNLYVEIQKHNIPDSHSDMPEDQLIDAVLNLADKRGLPIVATADSHYLEQSQQAAHSLMKKVGYMTSDGSDEFPGDTFHFPSTGWMKEKWSDDIWGRVEEACQDLLDKHNLVIPELDTYKPHVPRMAEDPDAELKLICQARLNRMFNHSIPTEYQERLDTELEVIAHVGVSDYALLILDTVSFFKRENILTESRGSVNGSLVFYLLGATQVDPIKWGTVFARFIDKSRVGQSPDVDQDIADSERWKVLEYLENLTLNGKTYKTSRIGTFGNFGQREGDENDTGSAFNKYIGWLRKKHIDQAIATDKKREIDDQTFKFVKYKAEERGAINFNSSPDAHIKTLEDVQRVHPEDYKGLKEIVAMNSVYQSRGMHAGGILISGEDVDIDRFIPLMFIPSSDSWVSQYTMKDVEQFGLLKLDILGQTSLSVMQKCQEFIGREDTHDFEWIPFDDPATLNMLKMQRNYTGIFHAEGYAKGIVMREMKPKNTEEIILWQAISMPGVVDSGAKDTLLARRKNKTKNFGYSHPLLSQVFDKTYGVMVYQEQVIQYCQGIGMTDKEVTGFFKIVKDSGEGAVERNRKRLEEAKPRFYELSRSIGLADSDIDWVWKQCIAMGGYAFSINHAAGYGIRTYRTAYLKKHYPAAYLGALLYCWSGNSKRVKYKGRKISMEERYLLEADRLGVPVLPVNINKSTSNWTIERDRFLRKGFLSVKGIGDKVAKQIEAGQPYKDMTDLCTRSGISGSKPYLANGELKGAIAHLDKIGALTF